jgi:hypothetical protein
MEKAWQRGGRAIELSLLDGEVEIISRTEPTSRVVVHTWAYKLDKAA